MSLSKGTAKVFVSKIFGQVNLTEDQIATALNNVLFQPIPDQSTTEHSQGICSWRDASRAPLPEETFLADGWMVFGVRVDKKKVDKGRIDLKVQEEFQAHLAAGAEGKFNFKQAKVQAKEELLRDTPPSPSHYMAALNQQKGILYVEGKKDQRDFVQRIFGGLGMQFDNQEYVSSSDILANLKSQEPVDLGADRPEFVPETAQYVVMDTLELELGDQRMVARNIGTELGAECTSFLDGGARIQKLKVELALSDEVIVKMNLKTGLEQLSCNPGKPSEGTKFEVLLWRLDHIFSVHYILGILG